MTAAAFHLPDPSLLPGAERRTPERLPGFGHPGFDELLPGGGLPRGAVTELRAVGLAAGVTTLALRACRAAQAQQRQQRCAFVDPSGTLFAPGALRLGVDLERLIVVRPRWGELEAVAALIAGSGVASLLVLDLQESPAPATRPANDAGLLARLSLALEGSLVSVLLLTRSTFDDEPLSAGVSLRLTATRTSEQSLQLMVQGRPLSRGRSKLVPWAELADLEEPCTRGASHGA